MTRHQRILILFYQNKIIWKTEADKPKRYERLAKKMKLQWELAEGKGWTFEQQARSAADERIVESYFDSIKSYTTAINAWEKYCNQHRYPNHFPIAPSDYEGFMALQNSYQTAQSYKSALKKASQLCNQPFEETDRMGGTAKGLKKQGINIEVSNNLHERNTTVMIITNSVVLFKFVAERGIVRCVFAVK